MLQKLILSLLMLIVCLVLIVINAALRQKKRARIDLLDLKEQREGEAISFFNPLLFAKMFYAILN